MAKPDSKTDGASPASSGADAVDIDTLARKRVAESFGALDLETARGVVKAQIAADAEADAASKKASGKKAEDKKAE